MITIDGDLNNDWYLDETNNIAIISGVEAVKQIVISLLRLWIGEYDFDNTIGMIYKPLIEQKKLDTNLFSFAIETNIFLANKYITDNQYKIKSISELTFNLNKINRNCNIQCHIFLENKQNFEVNI